ncbi:MAG TPA: Gfo/Idh/MocA family oxidoreductase [Planctomycetota bacterium]|jgi:predicted dehydrogenase|nr:Gfo/Idh/MocA family oxidoreductase [Planctomycetota bacterium]OQC19673.1 MAG: Glycosyl hydrolase family 109 protein 1 precursor [Planctomycetes bacterium ADurb.Bin069]HNR97882.1 Gfo/Idh/MocA family oxidoreductase [Planctomycetota bacterium]HNU24591.1 Gfo/Idh/MocA family oxidoreductase [Planctomycetota bacterium]HOE29017.1 Gfo/Idh/MocA family oxidoreductase [Planctomycetota bacterium]
MHDRTSRRSFIQALGAGAAGLSLAGLAAEPPIQGFEPAPEDPNASAGWKPVSDRKIRVGIVGFGVCQFGAAFGFQNHPNVQIAAVSDLIPERCAALAKACRCEKTYPSLEELVKDDSIEAVFVATDAPAHARHCIEVLRHGKHVASAVPAAFGSLEDAQKLFDTVKSTGRAYMLFETSCFHEDLYAMRQIYRAGGFGKLLYAEGEYYHWMSEPIPSYKDWRVGLPPQWYPTHSNAYYVGVTGGRFTEVTCLGMPSVIDQLKPENNIYKNPFGTEIALMRTSDGGMARMAVSWDSPGRGGEMGRIRGQKGSFYGRYEGLVKNLPPLKRPPLPPGVQAGGHGGSHGHLMNEFVTAILENRTPLVDIAWALNMSVAGVVAHESAMRDGETLKIPGYAL